MYAIPIGFRSIDFLDLHMYVEAYEGMKCYANYTLYKNQNINPKFFCGSKFTHYNER